MNDAYIRLKHIAVKLWPLALVITFFSVLLVCNATYAIISLFLVYFLLKHTKYRGFLGSKNLARWLDSETLPVPHLRVTSSGSVVFANNKAYEWLNEFKSGSNKIEVLLPGDFEYRLKRLTDKTLSWEYPSGQYQFECSAAYSIAPGQFDIFLRDVTEWRHSEEASIHYLLHDSITGLKNQDLFRQTLDDLVIGVAGGSQPFAVFLLSPGRLAAVQASVGRERADELLKLVSERIVTTLGELAIPSSVQLPVYQADRSIFAILCQGYTEHKLLQKILLHLFSKINSPFHLDGREFHLHMRAGISLFPQDGNDRVSLLRNAEVALELAHKEGHSNYAFYRSDMDLMAVEALEKENYLRYAIDKGELLIYYQPQIDVSTGQLCGIEALLRWEHPLQGIISPDKFIPLAEESGLITELTEWTLREACKQRAQWSFPNDKDVPVAVNISAEQFLHMDLPRLTSDVLAVTGLAPSLLELEITESVAVRDIARTQNVMKALKEKEILLAIDDFGTGFASMAYLKAFPIDKVKIDQQFVRNVKDDRYDAAICRSIIILAKSLALTVIAEGVDSKEQVDWLRTEQCTQMQGYFFYPPLSISQFEKLFNKT